MNVIDEPLLSQAIGMFVDGRSVREVAKYCGIAKETAHRIQKFNRMFDLWESGQTKILTGKRKNGKKSFVISTMLKDRWQHQHYT